MENEILSEILRNLNELVLFSNDPLKDYSFWISVANVLLVGGTLWFLIRYTNATEKMKDEIIRQTDLEQSPVVILCVGDIKDAVEDKHDYAKQQQRRAKFSDFLIRRRLDDGNSDYYLALRNVGNGTAFNVTVEKDNLETARYQSRFLAPNNDEQKFLMQRTGSKKIESWGDFTGSPIVITCNDMSGKTYVFEFEIKHLEVFNKTVFTDGEFSRILNHLNRGDRFEKAKKLRDRFVLKRDDESDFWVRFFNMDHWCQNEYQVAQQMTQIGRYENRYDVTLLINGLPLVQIELKRRGMDLKEAFNQIQRYHKHSFAGTLFEYVQIFVISNGVNTKYFANNPKQSYEQTFYWTDAENRRTTQLDEFTEVFLEKCFISEMIAQ